MDNILSYLTDISTYSIQIEPVLTDILTYSMQIKPVKE